MYTEDASRKLASCWTQPLPRSVMAAVQLQACSERGDEDPEKGALSSSPGLGHGRGDSPVGSLITSCPRGLNTLCSDAASTSLVLGGGRDGPALSERHMHLSSVTPRVDSRPSLIMVGSLEGGQSARERCRLCSRCLVWSVTNSFIHNPFIHLVSFIHSSPCIWACHSFVHLSIHSR